MNFFGAQQAFSIDMRVRVFNFIGLRLINR